MQRIFPRMLIALLVLTSASLSPAVDHRDGWLLHLPGMGGLMRIDRNVTAGLLQGGLDVDLQIYDWTGIDRGLIALGNVVRHEEQSKLVADMITRQFRAHPTVPITITAHSAGSGIAVWALEQLPDDVMIDDLLMIASALSPQYDLSRALRHVKHKVYAFNSEHDTVVLGAGTRIFGTVDRVKTNSAGLNGFVIPKGADEQQYAKLEQIAYDPDWMRFDNNGEHIGAMQRPFARGVIAPLLQGKGLPQHAATQPASQPVGISQ